MKKFQLLIPILLLAALITGCGANGTSTVGSASSSSQVVEAALASDTTTTTTDVVSGTPAVEYDNEDLTANISYSDLSDILLNGDAISAESEAVTISGTVATITAAGEYRISGTLNDGQIVVDTTDPETVTLVLDNAALNASNTAPLYIANAEKVVITLAEGSSNSITDGASYVFATENEEPNAALFSNDDLTINGTGSLTVTANYNNGIASDDDLKITGGNITVTAVNDGIKGKDSVAIKDGTILIQAGGDGIQSSNTEDTEKGYVAIEGGTITITSALDGIQAETSLLITGGQITITAGGGSSEVAVSNMGGRGQGWDMQNVTGSAISTKGLKGLSNVTIEGGTIVIDSLDDAIHSNNSVVISGGEIQMATSDDGIHADSSIVINGGTINLTGSYEGIESATITINDGEIHVVSSDDGINGSDGSGSGGMGGGMTASTGVWVSINGGYLYINAGGDGLDSNGTVAMTGGVVIDNGPTNNGNGALDYTGSFNISGGILVAVGSTGMAEAPSSDSSQYSVIYSLDSYAAAGTLLHIETADGQEIITFAPAKEYQSVVVSTPEMANGESYVVYSGGSATGTVVDGLYTDASYTPGTQVTTFSISSVVTSVNGAGFGTMPGGGGAPGGGGGGRHP